MIQGNINTPELFNKKFDGKLAVTDMSRLEALAKYFKGGVYVDVGCLDSPMPIILSERYPDSIIYGVDFADGVIDFLKVRFPKVKYIVAECTKLPFEDNSVDCVVAGEMIEHLEEPKKFFIEALRVLKPGGTLAISTPCEEVNGCVGGKEHLWSYTTEDMKDFGFQEIIVEDKTIIAWQRK